MDPHKQSRSIMLLTIGMLFNTVGICGTIDIGDIIDPPATAIAAALAKFGIKVTPGIGVAITLLSLPSIAASNATPIAPPPGVTKFVINLLDGKADASQTVAGAAGSSVATTAVAEFGVFNPTNNAGHVVVGGVSGWAFTKGGLGFSIGSPLTLTVDIQQDFVGPNSSVLLQVTDNGSLQISNNLPGGIASEIAAASDPSNPGVHVSPVTPLNTYFYLLATEDSSGALSVVNTAMGYSSPSEFITAADFTPTVVDGIAGFSFSGTRDLSLDFPHNTNSQFSAEAATVGEVPEPPSWLLAGLGALVIITYARQVHRRQGCI